MDNTTKRMIDAYFSEALPSLFLQGLFRTPPQNFFAGESVTIDIERGDEDVAIVVQSLGLGGRTNTINLSTSKEFTPPVYQEELNINGFDLIKRQPGQSPFDNPDIQANGVMRAMQATRRLEAKIRRAVELQASQVLQTGKLSLVDSGSNVLYDLDYKPKGSHYTSPTPHWDDPTPTILKDIEDVADIIRQDGLEDPDTLIFGGHAWDAFIADVKVAAQLNAYRWDIGNVAPVQPIGKGAKYMGWIHIGSYRFDMWRYNGMYTDPATGNKLPYIDPAKVIVRSSTARLDALYGAIPQLVPVDQRVLPFLPGRMSSSAGQIDLFPYAHVTPDGQALTISVGARPLLVPTAIDTYGCINTGVA